MYSPLLSEEGSACPVTNAMSFTGSNQLVVSLLNHLRLLYFRSPCPVMSVANYTGCSFVSSVRVSPFVPIRDFPFVLRLAGGLWRPRAALALAVAQGRYVRVSLMYAPQVV